MPQLRQSEVPFQADSMCMGIMAITVIQTQPKTTAGSGQGKINRQTDGMGWLGFFDRTQHLTSAQT